MVEEQEQEQEQEQEEVMMMVDLRRDREGLKGSHPRHITHLPNMPTPHRRRRDVPTIESIIPPLLIIITNTNTNTSVIMSPPTAPPPTLVVAAVTVSIIMLAIGMVVVGDTIRMRGGWLLGVE